MSNITIPQLPSTPTLTGAEQIMAVQSGASVKVTALQIAQLGGGGTGGITPPTLGGTGATSLTAHGLVVGNGINAVNVTSPGTTGQVLTSNGGSADPTMQTLPVTAVSGGGTGSITLTAHGVMIGEGTGPVVVAAPGAAGTVLTSNGASVDPSFQSVTVPGGGTGVAALAAHGVVIGQGAGPVHVVGPGTAGQVLTSNGASADPTFQTPGGGLPAGSTFVGNAGGSVNAMTAVAAISALTVGLTYVVKTNAANTIAAPTINIQSTGNKTIVKCVNAPLLPGDYGANQYIELLWDGTNMVLQNPEVSTPPSVGTNVGIMWGANAHPLHNTSPYDPGTTSLATQMSMLTALGFKSYRYDTFLYDSAHQTMLDNLVAAAAPTGITILPVLTPNALDPSYDSEALAYAYGYSLAFSYASNNLAIKVWEIGNEYEGAVGFTGQGSFVTNYDPVKYAKCRGLVRGMFDGIRAGNPNAKCAFGSAGGGGWGMMDGFWADGLRWDITVEHFYSSGGTVDNRALALAVGTTDKYALLRDHYHKPIWVTETNYFNVTDTPVDKNAMGTYLSTVMPQLDGYAKTYGIEAVHIYELLDEPQLGANREGTFGLLTSGVNNAAGTAVQTYLAAHPCITYDGQAASLPAKVQVFVQPPPLGTAAGTGDAMTITPVLPLTTLVTGVVYSVQAPTSANATTTPTINITGPNGSFGTVTIVKRVNTALAANDILANMWLLLLWNGTTMVLTNPVVN